MDYTIVDNKIVITLFGEEIYFVIEGDTLTYHNIVDDIEVVMVLKYIK